MEFKSKTIRKSLVLVLTFAMIFSMFSTVFAAGSSDVDGHWAEKQLKQWIDNGLLNGYGEGVYKPNQTITRAEAAALVNRSFEHEETAEVAFSDVAAEDWFYNEVSKALTAGFMTGYEDGTFKPDQNITRQELAVMIFRLLDLEANADAVASFDDVDTIADWAKGEIGALVDLGIVTGYNDNTIQPNGLTKRAEAIVMIERAFEYLFTYSEAGTYGPEEGTETITHNVTVIAADVTLQNLVIEGDLLLAEGIGEGDVYLNNVTVKGTTTILGGGENSVHLTDTVLVTVIVDKKDGKIRIVVKGDSEVKEVTLNSGAKLEESDLDGAGFADVILSTEIAKDANVELVGEFQTVDVFAATVSIEIPEGTVDSLNVDQEAEGVELDLGKEGTIVELVLDAVTEVIGEGTVESVEGEKAEASDVQGEDNKVPVTTGGGGGSSSDDDDDDTPSGPAAEAEEIAFQIGGEWFAASYIDKNEFEFVIPSELTGDEYITLIEIESTSSNAKEISFGSYEVPFDGDIAEIDLLQVLNDEDDPQNDGVRVATIRGELAEEPVTLTGVLTADNGRETNVSITLFDENKLPNIEKAYVFVEGGETLEAVYNESFDEWTLTIPRGLDGDERITSIEVLATTGSVLYYDETTDFELMNFENGTDTKTVEELFEAISGYHDEDPIDSGDPGVTIQVVREVFGSGSTYEDWFVVSNDYGRTFIDVAVEIESPVGIAMIRSISIVGIEEIEYDYDNNNFTIDLSGEDGSTMIDEIVFTAADSDVETFYAGLVFEDIDEEFVVERTFDNKELTISVSELLGEFGIPDNGEKGISLSSLREWIADGTYFVYIEGENFSKRVLIDIKL
ncbi:S-layer homology domain-containing protein [Chengkuizengella axinellae]|uniref:S-layer homology domain-containing protein n=1 Tax=Chengkuizengella axinellae TaxID=3064388 RepID=A0ABT9J6J2_9BACL|nr:S-layer homology domain-containing protein [Chengkuizengella sp. 2205SS18-9]MDP5276615.1 S-layer homology domain-containing protein [Chengkuizengella sp. 2205SS18-9]